jgi:hypothetical protein
MNPKPLRREGNLVREAMPKVGAARAKGGNENPSRAFGDRFWARRCAEKNYVGTGKYFSKAKGGFLGSTNRRRCLNISPVHKGLSENPSMPELTAGLAVATSTKADSASHSRFLIRNGYCFKTNACGKQDRFDLNSSRPCLSFTGAPSPLLGLRPPPAFDDMTVNKGLVIRAFACNLSQRGAAAVVKASVTRQHPSGRQRGGAEEPG